MARGTHRSARHPDQERELSRSGWRIRCKNPQSGYRLPMRPEIGVSLVRHGYDAVTTLRRKAGGADWFQARMLGRRALVVRGQEGVRTFYDPHLVTRKGAIPAPLRLLLFGRRVRSQDHDGPAPVGA